nr:hypothetical protein [Tanacetum cinerariifolium]
MMTEQKDYIFVTRKNCISNDNEGRMIKRNFVKIHGTFLVKTRENTFNGAIGENVFKHINKFLEVVGQIKLIGEDIEAEEDDDLDDITNIFKIKGNLFDYETPLCKAFNDFNYLLKINKDLFTFDIQGIRTYEEYELNNLVTRDLEEPWSDNGVPYQLQEALMQKAKVEESWGNATPGKLMVRPYANIKTEKAHDPYLEVNNIVGRNYDTSNAQDNKGHEERKDDPTLEPSVYKIKRFEMMKYSFNPDEEYITIKESEYLNHSKDNLDAYRELLRIID